MATVVYQGFQSHFESQHFEPRTLRLRLSSPNNPHLSTPLKSHFLDSSITPQGNTTTTNVASLPSSPDSNSDSKSNSWSFLESLSNTSSDDKEEKKILPYVQPPSSRRTLSDESLALCTESLGSETGSDTIEDLSLTSSELQTVETKKTTSRTSRQDRKRNAMASLPPPLTSMSGFDSIQVKSHRENGRLVMTAFSSPPRNRCLQDRSNGCVRLAFLVHSDDLHMVEPASHNDEETIETRTDNEEDIPEEVKEEETEVKGVDMIQRSRRCVEGDRENRGFLNWESFCIATS